MGKGQADSERPTNSGGRKNRRASAGEEVAEESKLSIHGHLYVHVYMLEGFPKLTKPVPIYGNNYPACVK